MASVKNIEFKEYCDAMYRELSGMKSRLLRFVSEIEGMKEPHRELLQSHITHFQDIVRTIEWKLEILTKVCPFDWKEYAGEVERASVESYEKEPVAGYVGG